MITDSQYREFLFKLATDQRGKNGLILSEWEQSFLDSFTRSSRPSLWFTEGRRTVTERMWMKLGGELGFPHPLDAIHEPPRIQDADPTGCEYLVRGDDGRQRRCNAPAVWQGYSRGPRPGLRYCESHKVAVERANKGMIINPFP